MKLPALCLIAVLTLTTSSLSAQNNALVFRFEHRVGSQPLVLDTTLFTLSDGKTALLTRAEFYISEIEVEAANGTKLPLSDFYLLVNANTPDRAYSAGNWNINAITGLQLHLGVDAAHNHLDPSAYPADHPLAHQNPSMHWGWVAGYRFMAIEGLVDQNNDGIPETLFQYHNLGDSLYQTVEIAGVQTAENDTLFVDLKLDYTRLFEKLDMNGNLTQHGSAGPNVTMMKNAASLGFISLNPASSVHAQTLQSARISAVPNPARSVTTIRYDLKTTGTVRMVVTNRQGQIVQQFDDLQPSGSLAIPLQHLPTGTYQYAFYNHSGLLAGKEFIRVE